MSITAKAPEAGFAYAFVSNEHPTLVDAYFDDVTFTHTPSPIVSVSDYFPYGLSYNQGERAGATEQKYLYNGKELQDELSLNWYDYGARMYMPEIGRWGVVDPMSEKLRRWSPYSYAVDNPVRFIDPDGMLSLDALGIDTRSSEEKGAEAMAKMEKQRKERETKKKQKQGCDGCAQSKTTTISTKSGFMKVDGKKTAVTTLTHNTNHVSSISVNENGVTTAARISNNTTTISMDGAGNIVNSTYQETSYIINEGKKLNGSSTDTGAINGSYNDGEFTFGEKQFSAGVAFKEIIDEAVKFEREEPHIDYSLSKAEDWSSNNSMNLFIFFKGFGLLDDSLDIIDRANKKHANDGVLLYEKYESWFMYRPLGNGYEKKYP